MKKILIISVMALALFALSAYDTVITVKSDGSGDYTNIAAAVASVQTSAIIYVYGPTTYNGTANKNISWNGTQKTIKIQGINNPVIDCEDSGCAFTIDYATQDDIIHGVSIINGNYYMPGGAIRIKDGCAQIIDCNFTNCHVGTYSTTFQMSPWTISRGGAIFIEHANSQQSSLISGNTFTNCVAWEGGAVCVETGFSVISQNSFTNCHACWSSEGTGDSGEGGAVYLKSSSTADISENSFTGNTSPCCGSAISSSGVGSDIFQNTFDANYRSDYGGLQASPTVIAYDNNIHHNVFKNHVYDISHGFSLIETDECYSNTFINNSTYTNAWNGVDCTYKNCIFNNNNLYLGGITAYANYCLFYNCGAIPQNVVLSNCIENTAPQLDASYTPLWNATTKSVCIDAGDPSILDADGTPSDIGAVSAVEHKIDSVPLIQMSSGINWKCFPVIDDIYSNSDVAGNFFDDIMQQINPSLYMVVPEDDQERIYWNNSFWLNDDQAIESVKGYKVYMNTPYTMEISGFLEDPSTVISLHSGENWIGYFLEDSMKPLDALASVLDDIDEIQTKTFTMEKTALGWLSSDKWTLNYGDLVIVNCTTPCNFYWGENGGGASETTIKSDAETFSYSEEADYIPVYVELDSQSRSNPVEIGLFVDGVCKGAEVITGSTVQIRAYVTGDSTAFDPGTVSFQLNYGERGENETISDYRIKTTINDHGSVRPLDFSENTSRYYIVSFEDVNGNTPEVTQVSLNQNYPNPFNPTTTISYALVKEGDVELTVYNTKGQKVKTLVNGSTAAGEHSVEWNGTDDTNAKVSSGLYFYRLKTTDKTINRKMVLLK